MVNPKASWKEIASNPAVQKSYAEFVKERDGKLRTMIEFDPARHAPASRNEKNSAVSGLPFAVKDNIAVEGFHLTCGSKLLEGVLSPYSATAVTRLQGAGAWVVGKTNLDEFGMGSSTENSSHGPSRNPFNPDRVTGGSSGGSAAAVAAGLVPFALGSDTGGSVRQPAAFCGVYGLKPTYGAVSRFGLVAYASSLEGIGVVARSVDLTEQVFRIMAGSDERDQTTQVVSDEAAHDRGNGSDAPKRRTSTSARTAGAGPAAGPGTVGVLGGDLGLTPAVEKAYQHQKTLLSSLGLTIREIPLPMLEYVAPAYYTIATAEASANLARFNGIRYGRRPDYAENPDDLVRIARSEGFGAEVKLRILLGTYVLRSGFQDQYYVRAQKIRTAIRNDLDRAFSEVDVILMPVFPTLAFPFGADGLTPFQQKVADRFASLANLAGVPALSVPVSVEEGLPAGMQYLAPHNREDLLFAIARRTEQDFPSPEPTDYPPHWS